MKEGRKARFISLTILALSALALMAYAVSYAQESPGPGLKAQISKVEIGADRRPLISYRLTDDKGTAFNRAALDQGSERFIIGYIKVDSTTRLSEWLSYVVADVKGVPYIFKGKETQPALAEVKGIPVSAADQGGEFTTIRPGEYTYKMKTALPASFDRNATHRVFYQATRDGRRYVANATLDFVPAGGAVQVTRDVVATENCNQCHDPLMAHGGTRRDVKACVLCHTSQLVDPETGENLEFKIMVHKIHEGKNLPRIKDGKPYLVIGFNQTPFDFSTVGFPQDTRNCTTCHKGASNSDNWKTAPSQAACVSCHEKVDLKTGENHLTGPAPDAACSSCHIASGPEFSPAVDGAHTIPTKSAQLPGVVFDILKVEDTDPGDNPMVTFSLKNKKGEPLEATKMANLRLMIAWPTTDYGLIVDEDAKAAQAVGGGTYIYKFKYVIPSDAKGSGAVGIQGYNAVDLTKYSGEAIKGVRDVGFNVVKYFPITDRTPIPRRTLVKIENCNVCHETLAPHGGTRRATEFCVMCHNPLQTDEVKRKVAKGPMPPESVHFKTLIHKLHTGERLGEHFVIYGGPPASPGPIDLSEVRFPGDRRNCFKCHVAGANDLPLPRGALPTLAVDKDGNKASIPPITATCLSCHSNESAKAHAELQVASGGRESCIVCHAEGREFAVTKMHARARAVSGF